MQDHDPMTDNAGAARVDAAAYSAPARRLHWITATIVVVMLPLGFGMAYRGNTLDIWDDVTNTLYSTHKLMGFALLWLMCGRLAYRLVKGAPPDEPGLAAWQRAAARLMHWALYGLLLIVPLLGWIGVSLYPALDIFGLFSLPSLAAPDEAAAKRVLWLHGWLAIALAVLVALHVAAALHHHLIRHDGVLRRMWRAAR